MLRGLSAAAVAAAAMLLSGCTSLPGSTASGGAATDTGNATCSGSSSGATLQLSSTSGSAATGIVAHGACSVVGVPDTATLLISVETQGPTARAATDAANGRADAVVGALRGKGIQQNDVRAGQLLVNPVISPIVAQPLAGGTTVGGTRITGYIASRLINATVRSIGSAATITSTVLDTAGDAGRVQLNYGISDDSGLRAQASAAAVHQAQEKAKVMAEAAGVSLGQLVSITEAADPPTRLSPTSPQAPVSGGVSASSVPTVTSDGQLIEVAVDVVYAVG
ncbi:MAG: SIMPL domain-containing protein [Pseudonocardia sp.]